MIETEDNIRYGGFVHPAIDNYQTFDKEGKRHGIVDPQSFVFSFKNNKPMKYEMEEDKKNESVFLLYDNDNPTLFSFGHHDILIKKKGIKSWCQQDGYSYYDYQENWKALTGKEGRTNSFDIKRIVVIEFK